MLWIEVTLPEALAFLAVLAIVVGLVLRHSLAVDRASAALAGERARLEREIVSLEQARNRATTRYHLHAEGGKVFQGSEELGLTRQEYAFLTCLLAQEGAICSYEQILSQVWPGEHLDAADRDRLRALVRRLRAKLAIPFDYIRNHAGQGYEFVQWAG
jgi:DNA-binding response OmpR family regulator